MIQPVEEKKDAFDHHLVTGILFDLRIVDKLLCYFFNYHIIKSMTGQRL